MEPFDRWAPGRRETRQALGLALAVWTAAALLETAPVFLTGHPVAGVVLFADAACSLLGAALSILIAILAQASWGMPASRRAGLAILGAALSAGLLVGLDAFIVSPMSDLLLPGQLSHYSPPTVSARILDFSFYLWIFEFYAIVVLLLESNRIAQERAHRLLEADTAAKTAQLSALRLQLSPHFLFNTLNAVSSLVVTGRNAEAELMIERLSEFLRTTLASGWRDETSLQDELALLELYLEIEAVRFGTRFRYVVRAPQALLGARVPSLILQPLAENAIKYAVAPSVAPITLQIEARREGGDLILIVIDDGAQAQSPPRQRGAGVGLANVEGRLRALYGDAGRFAVQASAEGFRAELRLPLDAATRLEIPPPAARDGVAPRRLRRLA